jgi:hypothetical protein
MKAEDLLKHRNQQITLPEIDGTEWCKPSLDYESISETDVRWFALAPVVFVSPAPERLGEIQRVQPAVLPRIQQPAGG